MTTNFPEQCNLFCFPRRPCWASSFCIIAGSASDNFCHSHGELYSCFPSATFKEARQNCPCMSVCKVLSKGTCNVYIAWRKKSCKDNIIMPFIIQNDVCYMYHLLPLQYLCVPAATQSSLYTVKCIPRLYFIKTLLYPKWLPKSTAADIYCPQILLLYFFCNCYQNEYIPTQIQFLWPFAGSRWTAKCNFRNLEKSFSDLPLPQNTWFTIASFVNGMQKIVFVL